MTQKAHHLIRESGLPDIKVEIWTNQSSTCLYARLIGSDGKSIAGFSKVRRVVHHVNEINRLRESVCVELRDRWNDQNGNKKELHKNKGAKHFFCDKYDDLPDKSVLDVGNWKENSTARAYHSFFRNQVLPALDSAIEKDGELNEFAMADIVQTLLTKSVKRKSSYNDSSSEARFLDKMAIMNGMLAALFRVCFSRVVNDIPKFPIAGHARAVQHEQQKWLEPGVRKALSVLLLEKVSTEEEALVCALMFCAGLRTSEAAAVFFKDVHISDDGRFAVLFVEKQLDGAGQCDQKLKTESGYRMVVLPLFFVVLYNKRIMELRKQGLSNEEILRMPLCDLHGKASNVISAYVKNLLEEAGMYDFNGIREAMKYDPDIVGDQPVTDPGAYILRRDWATRAVACGLSPTDVDYYLGHKNDSVNYKAYLNKNKQKEVALCLEDYIYHPACSFHPSVNQILLLSDDTIRIYINGRNEYVIKNTGNTKRSISLRIQSSEPGDSIKIISPRKAVGHKNSFCLEDKPEDRIGRIIPMKNDSGDETE